MLVKVLHAAARTTTRTLENRTMTTQTHTPATAATAALEAAPFVAAAVLSENVETTFDRVAFASDLGFPVAMPRIIRTDAGNGQPFVAVRSSDAKTVYKQSMGCLTLTVYHD
jgi:hypothetical protein